MNARESHGQSIESYFVNPASFCKTILVTIITCREQNAEINIVIVDLKIRLHYKWCVQSITKIRK